MRSELSKNRATNKPMLIKGVMASAVRFPLPSSPVIKETFFSNTILNESIIWINNESLQTGTQMLSYKNGLSRLHPETICNKLSVRIHNILLKQKNN